MTGMWKGLEKYGLESLGNVSIYDEEKENKRPKGTKGAVSLT